jgi:hypothetical protein
VLIRAKCASRTAKASPWFSPRQAREQRGSAARRKLGLREVHNQPIDYLPAVAKRRVNSADPLCLLPMETEFQKLSNTKYPIIIEFDCGTVRFRSHDSLAGCLLGLLEKLNSVACSPQANYTELPPLVSEVSANSCG